MSGNSAEIERIVRLVLNRLQLASGQGSALTVPACATAADAASRPAVSRASIVNAARAEDNAIAPDKALRLPSKLITLSCIEGRLEGVERLEVSRHAVITPAVHDELRHRSIRLERHAAPVDPTSMNDTRMLIVMDHPLELGNLGGTKVSSTGNHLADAGRIAMHLGGGGRLAMWVTEQPYAAAVAGAQNRSLRCVQLAQPVDLPRAQAEANPNVFILDGVGWELPQLEALGRDLLSSTTAGANR